MLLSPASSSASLPAAGGSFWNKFKPKPKEGDLRHQAANMALARQRMLTLVYGDQETLATLPNTFAELVGLAREWLKVGPDAVMSLRVPVDFASVYAANLVTGPYIYLTSEDSFQIAVMGVHGLRVEILSNVPPPPEEPPNALSAPPPPPILEMPATFNLELHPNQNVALEVSVVSDELDMSKMEDGTIVDGQFWGKLDLVHQGDDHRMEFSGTRLAPGTEYTPDFLVNTRVLSKMAVAAKPPVAKCQLSIVCPRTAFLDIILSTSQFWTLGITWPPAEKIEGDKVKYFVRCNPGGALEHFETTTVTTALYYEAMPDPGLLEQHPLIHPKSSFAMPTRDFLAHLIDVFDQLGLSVHARTNWINNINSFIAHKNIAYRFLAPTRIASAIDITVTTDCVFTRLFMVWRGISDEELGNYADAGEKEARQYNWREIIGWSEEMKDPAMFRILELSVMDIS